jgi:hypothetical protein
MNLMFLTEDISLYYMQIFPNVKFKTLSVLRVLKKGKRDWEYKGHNST